VTHFLRNLFGTPQSFLLWASFRLTNARAVRTLHGRMGSDGVQIQGIEEYPGYLTYRCTDPDGYGIEVYCE
jgi:hypothetical protein